MPQKDPSRTEKATDKRRNKAREEGNVPRSEEVSKVVVLLLGVFSLMVWFDQIRDQLYSIFIWVFSHGVDFEFSRQNVFYLLIFCVQKMAIICAPILLVMLVASFLSVRVQVGHLFTTKVFFSNIGDKFNIIKGIKNIFFSFKTLVGIFKNLAQVAVVGAVAYLVIHSEIKNFAPLYYQSVQGITAYILKVSLKMLLFCLLPMTLIAIIHFFYTRWDYEENLKMTKEEVKDEFKQSYGNPEIKKAQLRKMQEAMMRRMMTAVPEADVVITNPTQLAVALRYDPLTAPAPVVLAKGAGFIAKRIKEIAREHNVPIKEDKPLAQALYKSVEVGAVIPEELYQAVAAILAQLEKFRRPREAGFNRTS